MKKSNFPAIIFSVTFGLILINRWNELQTIDKTFYFLAIAGFFLMGIASIFKKHK